MKENKPSSPYPNFHSGMSAFSLFTLFYMTAFLLHMMEKWRYPGFTLIFFLVVSIVVITQINRLKFLVFLSLSTTYFLIFRFPDVANHVNFFIYCNIFMMVCMIYSFARPQEFATDDDYFDMIKPLLRSSLIVLYFLAGFHKFNSDFFHPEVGCGLGMIQGIFSHLGFHELAIAESLSVLNSVLIIAVSIFALCWELGAGLLLWFPRFQAPLLLLSWIMHAVFAINGFVDFGSLVFAFFFTFLPLSYYQVLQKNAYLHFQGFTIHRALVYFMITMIVGILSGIHFAIYPFPPKIKLISGVLFNLAAIIYAYPIFSARFLSTPRLPWKGVYIFNGKAPKFTSLFLLLLLFFGLNPYLGLRTAGTFSMFSNLRTEGAISNHLLLRNNPIKIWNYQENLVRFIEIDDDRVQIGHKYRPLKGNLLPAVEFKKLIYQWTQAGYTVPLKFEYHGQIYETEDITQEPEWRTNRRTWEMMLMDFRVVQPEGSGPNQCRW